MWAFYGLRTLNSSDLQLHTMAILFTNMPIVLGGSWLATKGRKKSHVEKVNNVVLDTLKKTHSRGT